MRGCRQPRVRVVRELTKSLTHVFRRAKAPIVHVSSGIACGIALALLSSVATAQPAPEAPPVPPAAPPAPPADGDANDPDEDPPKPAPAPKADSHTLPKLRSSAPPPPPAEVKDDAITDPRVRPVEPGQGKPRPFARDERTGHVLLHAGASVVLPAGSIRSSVATNSVVNTGLGIVAGIGVGVSRHTELDVTGNYGLMSVPSGQGGGACVKCKGDHEALSLGLTYHLAEGIALDPWMRFGSGYRTAKYAGTSSQLLYLVDGRFHGWDVAQISLGASFFPTPSFGFGPFMEADIGTYLSRPETPTNRGQARTYGFFQFGIRLELDPARWLEHPEPSAKKRTASFNPPSF